MGSESSSRNGAAVAPPSPLVIAEKLAARVVGQRRAVARMAIALGKRMRGLPSSNLLLIGSSGTGKTTLMRVVEEILPTLHGVAPPMVRLHAVILGEEAELGRPAQILGDLLLEGARRQHGANDLEHLLAMAGSGIVFVDEVDKIRTRIGDQPYPAGVRAQEALLTLMEGERAAYRLPSWAGGGQVTLDTANLLFVAAGAFEGLYDQVFKRVTVGEDRGALEPVTVVEDGVLREELPFRLQDWLRSDDLFAYGVGPQFLSRFEDVVLLEPLGDRELVRILLEAPDSAYRRAQDYFGTFGVDLMLSPAGAQRIAAVARRVPRLGARALNEIFQRVVGHWELDPSAVEGGALYIDADHVESALAEVPWLAPKRR
jgi:ATP-dependent Clp protease ATP-binding subunit ClpX